MASEVQQKAAEVQQKTQEVVAHHGEWIEWAGRAGFATKAVVYGIIGVMALATGWGDGRAMGSTDAIETIGHQPFGHTLLWLTALGLAGYALWRFVEAAVDPEYRGTETKDLLRRVGYAINGVLHMALAVYAAPVSLINKSGSGEDGLVARVLALPGGMLIVAAVGLGILGFACYELYSAWTQRFMKKYPYHAMNETEEKTARYAGSVGLAARGLTFFIIGAFVVVAAVRLDPSQTKNSREALELLAQQPYGPWLLSLVGFGLVCYAIHCGAQAYYRRFNV